MTRESGDESRELTASELDTVSGGGFGRLANIAGSKAADADSDALQAAQGQRERQNRQQSLRDAMRKFYSVD